MTNDLTAAALTELAHLVAELRYSLLSGSSQRLPAVNLLEICTTLHRLCALLTLTPGERSFVAAGLVAAGLDAATEADLVAAWMRLVFWPTTTRMRAGLVMWSDCER